MVRLNRRFGDRVVVSLVGVQTNQFCRASDIALALRHEGVPVLVGGFHVSGTLALFPTVSPEIQALLEAGVSVVAGEVEDHWMTCFVTPGKIASSLFTGSSMTFPISPMPRARSSTTATSANSSPPTSAPSIAVAAAPSTAFSAPSSTCRDAGVETDRRRVLRKRSA
jgi:hypothetical protein